MNSFHELADRNGNRHVGVLVLVAQMVHLVIMGDFFYPPLPPVREEGPAHPAALALVGEHGLVGK